MEIAANSVMLHVAMSSRSNRDIAIVTLQSRQSNRNMLQFQKEKKKS
jgi:hypothetical protein